VAWAAALLALAALAVVPGRLREHGSERCAFDGALADTASRVRVVDADGRSRAFCSLSCASAWLQEAPPLPRSVFVTDETTGREVRARDAFFVRSAMPGSDPTTGRIHVFALRADAERHVSAFGGVLLEGGERPLKDSP
jgi:hypothetical protein